MGSDELHKKRQSKPKPKSGNLMMIICEGEKSELSYMDAFIKEHKDRDSGTIKKSYSKYTDPLSIINKAIELKEDGHDKVICVFDKDTHSKFTEAVKRGKQKGIKMIISEPCFEFWLLLHFEDTSKSFGAGEKAPCQECIKELKEYLRGYEKGDKNVYEKTKDKIETATQRARRTQKGEGSKTNFYELLKMIKEFLRPDPT